MTMVEDRLAGVVALDKPEPLSEEELSEMPLAELEAAPLNDVLVPALFDALIEEELSKTPLAELEEAPLKTVLVPTLFDDELGTVAELEMLELLELLDAGLLGARELEVEDDEPGNIADVSVSMSIVLPLGSLKVMVVVPDAVTGVRRMTALSEDAVFKLLVEYELPEEVAGVPAR